MKTIHPERARYIAQQFHGGQHSALYSFGSTGIIYSKFGNQYQTEVQADLNTPEKFLKKDLQDLQLLLNYFNKVVKSNAIEIPSQNQATVKETIARAWVLEGGRDCDGVYTRGMVIACGNLLDATGCMYEWDNSSDGNYYKITEKWSEVVDYCNNYFMEYDKYAMVTYIP